MFLSWIKRVSDAGCSDIIILSLLGSKEILCFFTIFLLPNERSPSEPTDVFHLVSVRILLDFPNGTNGTEKQWRLTVLSFPFSSRTPN
jgi:hypothetical protein